jgi:hypothetical protein
VHSPDDGGIIGDCREFCLHLKSGSGLQHLVPVLSQSGQIGSRQAIQQRPTNAFRRTAAGHLLNHTVCITEKGFEGDWGMTAVPIHLTGPCLLAGGQNLATSF